MYKITPSSLKLILISFFLLAGSLLCHSQNTVQKSDFWNKVRFGGGIGLGFSNGGFNGNISPSAIYQFNEYIAAGLGVNVNFYKFNNQKFWAYGPSAIVLANPIPQLQISGEFEQLRVNSSFQTITTTVENDFWSPALFLGLGYQTQFATVGIRYNVLHYNNASIYLNAWAPFVRVYF
jgi:hypothetical protein